MNKMEDVVNKIHHWYEKVKNCFYLIEQDASKIDEIIELRIDGIDLDEYDLADIEFELANLYEGTDYPIINDCDNHWKEISFDRYFDQNFIYENRCLIITTGFVFNCLTDNDDVFAQDLVQNS